MSTFFQFVGDDLAIDFVNTLYGLGEARCEGFTSDADVREWLRQSGLPDTAPDLRSRPGALLKAALALREAARAVLEARKAESVGRIATINEILATDNARPELVWDRKEGLALQSKRTIVSLEMLLLPIAEALARLLTEVDFDNVRKCESDECTLWFHDRTKSHRRRWCSMSLCGNRAKVAAFRARGK